MYLYNSAFLENPERKKERKKEKEIKIPKPFIHFNKK